MGQGMGSASLVIVAMASLFCLMVHTRHAYAATYMVGGSRGWTFNVDGWPTGKRFKAGDTLIFNYDQTMHNVVAVSRSGYGTCTAPASGKVYQSGKDQIKLLKGQNYFICSNAGHCQSGMKIAMTAV